MPPAPREPSREQHHDVRIVQGRPEHHAAGDPRRRASTRTSGSSTSPQSAHVTTAKAEALNFCANNYLGLADHPTVIAAAKTRWTSGASAWPACASSAARRRCTPSSRRGCRDVPRHRGHDPVLLLLRRQRRRLRDAVRRRGRHHLRRAQPRLHHRRHPAVQGPPAPLPQRATWPTSRRSSSPPRTRAAASSSPTASSRWTAPSPRSTRSATWPSGTTRWSWSTTPTPSASSARAAAAPPSTSASRTASTSSPAPSARRSAAPPAATSRARREIVDLLRQRSRPYLFSNSVAPAVVGRLARGARAGRGLRRRPRASCADNAALFRTLMTEAGFDLLPGIAPDRPGDVPRRGRRAPGSAIADAMLADGVYVIAFCYPVVPQGQGADPRPAVRGAQRGRRTAVRRGVRRRPGRGGLTGPGQPAPSLRARPVASGLRPVGPAGGGHLADAA